MNQDTLTRRAFLGGLVVTGAATLMTSCRGDQSASGSSGTATSGTGQRSPDQASGSFPQPEVLTSSDGALDVDLIVESVDLPWQSGTRAAYVYNGATPGPTLRVRQGDKVTIRVENRLDEPTNLHTHGLHVSPDGDGDNIFITVEPGETKTYEYQLPDEHLAGTFWYHPHPHGATARQLAAGLAGAIIVDPRDDEATTNEGDANPITPTERLWILADPPIVKKSDEFDNDEMAAMTGREGSTILVNGAAQPVAESAVGDVEHWRFVNASASRYYALDLSEQEFSIIGADGSRLAEPIDATNVLIAPAERLEILFAPTQSGDIAVRSLGYDRLGMGPEADVGAPVTLATVRVADGDKVAPLPTLSATPNIAPDSPTNQRMLDLGMGHMMGSGGMVWTIDGNLFDPERVDISVPLGTVEEWEIRNPTTFDHPFHLHVWPFWVESIGAWKDTINVAAQSSVKVVIPFVGIAGRSVYHCHIVDHEDLGMMGVIEVTE